MVHTESRYSKFESLRIDLHIFKKCNRELREDAAFMIVR